MEDETERALQLAGLISTLFKIKGVALVVTGQLAFDSYANTASERPEVEMASLAGDLAPRTLLEIMRGQLYAQGTLYHWTVAGIPVRFYQDAIIANRELCREFTTDHGVVKLLPVEEITADCILAAVHPEPNHDADTRARLLLINALADVFHMDWPALHSLCHRPGYRVGEELAQMRLMAKKEVDAMGAGRDHIGTTSVLPKVEVESFTQEESVPPAAEPEEAAETTPAAPALEEAAETVLKPSEAAVDQAPKN